MKGVAGRNRSVGALRRGSQSLGPGGGIGRIWSWPPPPQPHSSPAGHRGLILHTHAATCFCTMLACCSYWLLQTAVANCCKPLAAATCNMLLQQCNFCFIAAAAVTRTCCCTGNMLLSQLLLQKAIVTSNKQLSGPAAACCNNSGSQLQRAAVTSAATCCCFMLTTCSNQLSDSRCNTGCSHWLLAAATDFAATCCCYL